MNFFELIFSSPVKNEDKLDKLGEKNEARKLGQDNTQVPEIDCCMQCAEERFLGLFAVVDHKIDHKIAVPGN